jgi:hypothetical protein
MKGWNIAQMERMHRRMNPPQTGRYRVGDKVLVRSSYYGCTISTEIIARYDGGKYDVRTPRSKWNMTDRSSFERIGEDRIIEKL